MLDSTLRADSNINYFMNNEVNKPNDFEIKTKIRELLRRKAILKPLLFKEPKIYDEYCDVNGDLIYYRHFNPISYAECLEELEK